ncbi:hypothetical protein QBC39DRAFT_243621, partial [Podospora conica]
PNVITAGGTGKCKPVTWTNEGTPRPTQTYTQPVYTPAFNWKDGVDVDTGDIFCRQWSRTYGIVSEKSCDDLRAPWDLDVDRFYMLNPTLSRGCVGIRPMTEYCIRGFIEPLRAYDGRCGPPNKNATCIGMDMGQCCNSEKWTCGESEKDCSPGICYEGACRGHDVFTTDGTCGYQNEHRRCVGKWGDCCNVDGKCGTGWDFCENEQCQSGNC